MPLFLDTVGSASALERRNAACINIGLVNNMPDAALAATERQFIALLRAAAPRHAVRLVLFAMPEVPRGAFVRDLVDRYRDVSELGGTNLDGLIVTGAEPRAASLKNEPYWTALTRLADWSKKNTASAIWSCLAAHAAVLHADGIEREALAEKRFGVFECDVVAVHPLTQGLAPIVRVPHSRHNNLSDAALVSCGYRLLTRSAAAGADMFVKEERNLSSFVFLQGHPEYEPDTLLREYRRDVGRFLRGEQERYPGVPQGYLDDEAAAVAAVFRTRAMRERCRDLAAEFPMAALERALTGGWRRAAIGIYANWLNYLEERQAERSKSVMPWPSSRRSAWSDASRSNAGVRSAADRSSIR